MRKAKTLRNFGMMYCNHFYNMKKTFTLVAAFAMAFSAGAVVPHRMNIPDIPGYQTLKGDFHVHTVFSDDTSWPATRIDEAYYDGLDVISITDHCDTRHRKQVKAGYLVDEKCDRNASYIIARERAKKYGIIVLHGAELTRGSRDFPGHFNAHFINDGEALCAGLEAQDDQFGNSKAEMVKKEEVALENGLKAARAQGAFLVWNHPNWEPQEPNEVTWHPIHEKLYTAGLMDGIEVENHSVGFCPEALHFAMERNLTIVSGTDCHVPMNQLVDYELGEYRSMTLIFAKERTVQGVREALNEHRTAVYADGAVYGKEEYLRPLLKAMIEQEQVKYSANKVSIRIRNNSSIPVRLRKAPGSEKLVIDRVVKINPGEEMIMTVVPVGGAKHFFANEFSVNYFVENFQSDANTPILLSFPVSLPAKYRK